MKEFAFYTADIYPVRTLTFSRLIATAEMKKLSSDDDIGTRCGIGRYRPDWLQVLNNPKVLCTLLGIYIFFHGMFKVHVN